MFRRVLLSIVILILLVSASNLNATEKKVMKRNNIKQLESDQKDSTNLKLKALEKLINELKAKVEKKEKQDEFKKLLEEASELSTAKKKKQVSLSKKFHSGVRQQSGLNPNISVAGDFFGGISSTKSSFTNDRSDATFGSNTFDMRELQLNFVAPLDPFTRGKAFLSFTEGAVTIEEGYLEWLNLPLNVNLKIGMFRPEFGALNRHHDHALPQYDRPKVMVNQFSIWSLVGLGASANFLLPPMFFADASMLEIAMINGGADFSFPTHSIIYIGHFKNYYDISRDTYFEWALSSAIGKNDPDKKFNSYVNSIAFTYKWVPIGKSRYRTFDWKTEFLYSYREDPIKDIISYGFYTSLQNKLNARWWVSGRVGYSELPYDNKQHEWDFTGCVDFWQSEFVFIRLQYQYSLREFTNYYGYRGPYPNDHSLVFHVCWAMGPHKHEAY